MSKITLLVCLYNKNIATSNTLRSLLKSVHLIKNETVFIWDNSPHQLEKSDFELLNENFIHFKYKHTPENVVLSKVYNSVIAQLSGVDGYLMLCDDDSEIPESFFVTLKEQLEENPLANLFLPQIYSNSILVSPAKDYLIKTSHIKGIKSGILSSNFMTAINSGMVISNRVFNNGFRYDERLNFYGTDNYFMYHYTKTNKNLVVLDVKINHDLSFNSSDDINNKVRIFKEHKRSNRIIYSGNGIKRALVLFNNCIVSLKLAIQYKTLSFLYD